MLFPILTGDHRVLLIGRWELLMKFQIKIFKLIWVSDGWGITCEIALRWMTSNHTDDKSTLVQVMACCHQATRYYLSQCWPRSVSPYGLNREYAYHNGNVDFFTHLTKIVRLIEINFVLIWYLSQALAWTEYELSQKKSFEHRQVTQGQAFNSLRPSDAYMRR